MKKEDWFYIVYFTILTGLFLASEVIAVIFAIFDAAKLTYLRIFAREYTSEIYKETERHQIYSSVVPYFMASFYHLNNFLFFMSLMFFFFIYTMRKYKPEDKEGDDK